MPKLFWVTILLFVGFSFTLAENCDGQWCGTGYSCACDGYKCQFASLFASEGTCRKEKTGIATENCDGQWCGTGYSCACDGYRCQYRSPVAQEGTCVKRKNGR